MKRAPNSSFTNKTGKERSLVFVTIFRKQIKIATPIPSLNNDSPSITEVTFLDKPHLFKIEVAAIGSVGDTIQPSIIQSQISKPRFKAKFNK